MTTFWSLFQTLEKVEKHFAFQPLFDQIGLSGRLPSSIPLI